jgi:hypothetical protein
MPLPKRVSLSLFTNQVRVVVYVPVIFTTMRVKSSAPKKNGSQTIHHVAYRIQERATEVFRNEPTIVGE